METNENLSLIKKAKLGDEESIAKIVENSTKLIKFVNSKYGRTEDGFQEGVIGVLKAIENFDENKNIKFSTFAYIWIENKIKRYVEREIYRTSAYQIEKIKKDKSSKVFEVELKDIYTEEGSWEDSKVLELAINDLIADSCTNFERFLIKKLFYENYKQTELAREINVSKQYINFQKNRILMKLRNKIKKS